MTEPYLGEIQVFGFTYAPYQWAFCAGQSMPLQQNTALFALIGVTFGGNGTTSFQLPNLAARMGCGVGQGPGTSDRQLGETFGTFTETLTPDQLPPHNHTMVARNSAVPIAVPTINSALGRMANENYFAYANPGAATTMNPLMVQPAGSNMPHANQQPYLGLNHCIALSGTFPSFP
jgi:microcystin-dependent protein